MKLALVFAMAAALSGCGGGSASAPRTVTLAAYGDSTTYGAVFVDGAYSRAQMPEPEALQEILGPSVVVQNDGISGTTASQWLQGIHGVPAPWSQIMAQQPADLISISLGINDVGAPGATVNTIIGNLRQMIDIAQQDGKQVILITPNPVAQAGMLPSVAEAELRLAQQMNLLSVDQYDYVLSIPGWQSMLGDGIHPDQALYDLEAKYEASVLAQILGN